MWVGNGYQETAHLFLEGDRKCAEDVFGRIKGKAPTPKSLLRMDLVEQFDMAAPALILASCSCNLSELTENIKCITMETFKALNLE